MSSTLASCEVVVCGAEAVVRAEVRRCLEAARAQGLLSAPLEIAEHDAASSQPIPSGAGQVILCVGRERAEALAAVARARREAPGRGVVVLVPAEVGHDDFEDLRDAADDALRASRLSEASLARALQRAGRVGSAAGRSFQSVVEQSPDGLALISPRGETLYVNPGFERLLGHRAEDLVGRMATIFTHPEDIASGKPPAPGATSVRLGRSRHRDGSWRWLESVVANRTNDPAIGAYVVNFRDVTDRREAERAALVARRRMEYLLSVTTAVTYSCQPSGDYPVTYISENVRQVTGYEPRQFLADPRFWWERLHPEDVPRIEQALPQLHAGQTVTLEYRFRHANGSWRWTRDETRIVAGEGGEPGELVGCWLDVTAEKLSEAALRRTELNFRTLIERLPDAVLVHRQGRTVYVNPALLSMLGHDRQEELLDRSPLEIVHLEDRAQIEAQMARTASGERTQSGEIRLLRRDGGTLVTVGQGALLDFDGAPASVVLINDLTERREMFARVAVADRMLSVGTLAAGVAHEINNPLAYVSTNLALLAAELPRLFGPGPRSRLTPADVEKLLSDARDGAARVAGIVRDLRAMSRADEETRAPIDVRRVLDSSIQMVRNEIRHRARLVVQHPERLPPVFANETRLGQVFLNLLINAAQAIDDGHAEENEIRVRTRESGDGRVEVEVEDTGAGIAPQVVERVFDPFFTTKPIGVGTGLGLTICHGIVTALGGEISVRSRVGEGTCFRVTLPAAAEGMGVASPQPESPSAVRPLRVLLVDDEPAFGTSMRLLLAPDHSVVATTRAVQALEWLASSEPFDAILCDLMMPEMNGIEFHEQLVQRWPEYRRRVIFLTGGTFTAQARDFLERVSTPRLEKPFREEDLRARLREVVG